MVRRLSPTPVAAVLVGLLTFLLYRATLLPDVELGDSASFQVMAGSTVITPRDGYPLYYALAAPFVPFLGSRAHAMNLVSAIEAALACAVIVLLAAELSGSVLAAVAAALFFAGSYTFWSQAIIAEVYGLHILLVSLTLWLLLRWQRRPSLSRLSAFFIVYAIAFGNHLSMILLAPAYALFLLAAAPGGWRAMTAPRLLAVAAACAAIGAMQYAWNFQSLWLLPDPPPNLAAAFETFWFDVTKADWRDTMVLSVPSIMAGERLRMYLFDVAQQFGWVPPALALVGIVHLARSDVARALLTAGVYVVTLAFALGYNVGDTHVFFLPSHLMIALLTAPALASLRGSRFERLAARLALAGVLLALGHIYRDYPALDRSGDTRPTDVLNTLTEGIDDRNAVLVTDLNWQVQNGLTYFAEKIRTDVAYVTLAEVMLYAPALIRDNLAIGRAVVLTERARRQLHSAYGPLFATARDERVTSVALVERLRNLPPGTPYVLCVLTPSREFGLDTDGLAEAVRIATGGRIARAGDGDYAVLAGLLGEAPALARSSMTPFRERIALAGARVDIRMESWLAFDTIRRMGFGHVIADRRHALIVERGVSFVAFDRNGRASSTLYDAGIFAPQPRYRVLSSR